jgi:hypothetical protein
MILPGSGGGQRQRMLSAAPIGRALTATIRNR